MAQERLDACIELKRTERRALWHVAREGTEARERMIVANIRLVRSIARKHLPRATASMDFEDLVQASTFGLMRAVEKFDHTLGHKFSTYATWWITQSMRRAIDDEARTARLPVYVAEECRSIDTARRRAGLTWAEALAARSRLGDQIDASQVERARELLRPWLSLEQVDDELDVLDDSEPALDILTGRLDAEHTWRCLSEQIVTTPGLGPRAVESLELRHGLRGEDPMTLDQIGRRFGVTRERIRLIEKKALEAVRVDQVNLVNHH